MFHPVSKVSETNFCVVSKISSENQEYNKILFEIDIISKRLSLLKRNISLNVSTKVYHLIYHLKSVCILGVELFKKIVL